ncbi:hypothetical protein H7U19_16735 [Hyunsoonleella sp. SJ7]|uniref:Uncharacterized protein n=1 Tax=Hyunsoonleella aquatilis TaxID=2762758 RepID=A0A923KHA5_9FLAO|nr:hypothetical protein [Hyunsoonleella aquatilis]MBC3760056.1 hypothetical protein [Hyunsoonleella aquatilis]
MNKILFLLIVCTVISCAKEKEINQEFGNIPTELISALESINKSQVFEINPSQPNTLVGKSGTILLIPENSIVDQNGNVVSKNVFIEIKENFTKSDFITSNLQTIHNDKILESLGMVFLSANDENGNELKIGTGKSIRLQIPQKGIKEDAKIFLGNREEDGLINWDKIEEPSKSLTPYPIKFISKNRFLTECSEYYGITTDTLKYAYYNYFGNITDFENTLLATKEFSDRFSTTCWKEVLNIYINNLDKNLWEIDELTVQYFIKDSTERVNYHLNNIPPGPNGGPRTKMQKEAHESILKDAKEHGRWKIELYKKFASQKLTKIDTSRIIDTTKLKELNNVLITYDAINFGWINVDFFYEDPKASPTKLAVKTSTKSNLTSLILEERNVILSGIEKSTNEYWFTKNEDGYNKLPKGEKAIIISIGFDNSGLTFGERVIVIGENEEEFIEVKPISEIELKEKLKKYGS